MKKFKKDTFTISIIIIGILAAFTIFLPTMEFPNSETSFAGYELVLGIEFVNLGIWASGYINFSFLGIIAYLLPIAAVLSVVFIKKGYLIAILLFASSAILLFLMPEYIKTTVTIFNTETEIEIDWVNLYGLILAQSMAIIGLLLSLIKAVKFPNTN